MIPSLGLIYSNIKMLLCSLVSCPYLTSVYSNHFYDIFTVFLSKKKCILRLPSVEYSEPSQMFKVKLSMKTVSGFQPLTIFTKILSLIFDWVLNMSIIIGCNFINRILTITYAFANITQSHIFLCFIVCWSILQIN